MGPNGFFTTLHIECRNDDVSPTLHLRRRNKGEEYFMILQHLYIITLLLELHIKHLQIKIRYQIAFLLMGLIC